MRKCPSKTGFFKVNNLFGELLTNADKQIARNNLGIPEDSSLYWGNLKGYLTDQKDLIKFVNAVSEEKVKNEIAELLKVSPDTITLIESIANWIVTDESGAATVLQAITKNEQDIKAIKNSTVYLTQEEYDKLIIDELIDENTEYNIYEEE